MTPEEEAAALALAASQEAERQAELAASTVAEAEHQADNIVAGAAEAGVAAAQAGAALAETHAANVIAENQEDMAWLRNEVTRQGTILAETTSLLQTLGSQVLAISEAMASLTPPPPPEEMEAEEMAEASNPADAEESPEAEPPRKRRHRLI